MSVQHTKRFQRLLSLVNKRIEVTAEYIGLETEKPKVGGKKVRRRQFVQHYILFESVRHGGKILFKSLRLPFNAKGFRQLFLIEGDVLLFTATVKQRNYSLTEFTLKRPADIQRVVKKSKNIVVDGFGEIISEN